MTQKPLVLYNGEAYRIIDCRERHGLERIYYRSCQKYYVQLAKEARLVIYNSEMLKQNYENKYVFFGESVVAYNSAESNFSDYTNASKKLPFDLITSSFITVLLPKITRLISNKEKQETVKVYRAFLEFSYSSTIILACGAIAAAPQLMNLLYTEKYLSGISIFVVYILVDIMQFTNITLILSASGKTKTLMLLSGGSIVLNIGMNFLLFHLLGVIGPAIATLLITSLTGAAILYFSAKKLGTRITGFFDFRYLIRLLAENIAAVTVLACLRNLLESAGLNNLLILLLICGTYYVILLALNKKRLIVNLKEIG